MFGGGKKYSWLEPNAATDIPIVHDFEYAPHLAYYGRRRRLYLQNAQSPSDTAGHPDSWDEWEDYSWQGLGLPAIRDALRSDMMKVNPEQTQTLSTKFSTYEQVNFAADTGYGGFLGPPFAYVEVGRTSVWGTPSSGDPLRIINGKRAHGTMVWQDPYVSNNLSYNLQHKYLFTRGHPFWSDLSIIYNNAPDTGDILYSSNIIGWPWSNISPLSLAQGGVMSLPNRQEQIQIVVDLVPELAQGNDIQFDGPEDAEVWMNIWKKHEDMRHYFVSPEQFNFIYYGDAMPTIDLNSNADAIAYVQAGGSAVMSGESLQKGADYQDFMSWSSTLKRYYQYKTQTSATIFLEDDIPDYLQHIDTNIDQLMNLYQKTAAGTVIPGSMKITPAEQAYMTMLLLFDGMYVGSPTDPDGNMAAMLSFWDQKPIINTTDNFIDISLEFIAPYSPIMAQAISDSHLYVKTAEIKNVFNFDKTKYTDFTSTSVYLAVPHSNTLPNFYSFLSMINFYPNSDTPAFSSWGNTTPGSHYDQITLFGSIPHWNIPLVMTNYLDHEYYSQVPAGHFEWENNEHATPLTAYDVGSYDYWNKFVLEYENLSPSSQAQLVQKNSNIFIPYKETNYLTDFNEMIEYFPFYNSIELACDRSVKLPKLLHNTKMDNWIMKLIAYSVEHAFDVSPTQEQAARLGMLTFTRYEEEWSDGNPFFEDSISDLSKDYLSLRTMDFKLMVESWMNAKPGDFWDPATIQPWLTDYVNIIGNNIDGTDQSDSEFNFTKTVYSLLFSHKFLGTVLDNFRSYEQMIRGAPSYSELIMFRIEKLAVFTPNPGWDERHPIQNIYIWNTGEQDMIKYLDTQVKYGEKYSYRVYAYYFTIGNKYSYDGSDPFCKPFYRHNNIAVGNDFESDDWDSWNNQAKPYQLLKSVDIMNYPILKVIEVPYYGFEEASQANIIVMDNPPVPPDVTFIPYRSISNKINITIKTNSGEYSTKKLVSLLPGDNLIWEKIRESQNVLPGNPITFKSDSLPAEYEVFRIGPALDTGETKPPLSYDDFFDKRLLTVISGMSVVSFDDNIEPNRIYYYTIRAKDKLGTYGQPAAISNPSPVFKVEMVHEPGKNIVFPYIVIYEFEETLRLTYKKPFKSFKRYLHVKPAYENTLVNDQLSGYTEAGSYEAAAPQYKGTANYLEPVLGVKDDNYSLWAKPEYVDGEEVVTSPRRFKIRLTSKHTGKKIDINVGFVHKHNE